MQCMTMGNGDDRCRCHPGGALTMICFAFIRRVNIKNAGLLNVLLPMEDRGSYDTFLLDAPTAVNAELELFDRSLGVVTR
jgi:hypothetical protein